MSARPCRRTFEFSETRPQEFPLHWRKKPGRANPLRHKMAGGGRRRFESSSGNRHAPCGPVRDSYRSPLTRMISSLQERQHFTSGGGVFGQDGHHGSLAVARRREPSIADPPGIVPRCHRLLYGPRRCRLGALGGIPGFRGRGSPSAGVDLAGLLGGVDLPQPHDAPVDDVGDVDGLVAHAHGLGPAQGHGGPLDQRVFARPA